MPTITSGYLYAALSSLNCCAATIGYNRIKLLEKGQDDKCMVEDSTMMVNLIDDILIYSTIYSQASYSFSVSASANLDTLIITIDGVSLGTVVLTTSNTTTSATEIAAYINLTDDYTAVSNTNNITIYGTNASDDNDDVISFAVTGSLALTTPGTLELTGGDDYLSRNADTCITLAQIGNILNKISKLCNNSCN